MKEKFQKIVRKCDSLLGWTVLFYILITWILLYSIFNDMTNLQNLSIMHSKNEVYELGRFLFPSFFSFLH